MGALSAIAEMAIEMFANVVCQGWAARMIRASGLVVVLWFGARVLAWVGEQSVMTRVLRW